MVFSILLLLVNVYYLGVSVRLRDLLIGKVLVGTVRQASSQIQMFGGAVGRGVDGEMSVELSDRRLVGP